MTSAFHPLTGSEDTPATLTPAQHTTFALMQDAYESCYVDRVLPDGTAWVVTERDGSVTHHELDRSGIPT